MTLKACLFSLMHVNRFVCFRRWNDTVFSTFMPPRNWNERLMINLPDGATLNEQEREEEVESQEL